MVIEEVLLMIEKVFLGISSFWGLVQLLGALENKKSLPYQQQRQNILLQPHLHARMFS